MLENFPKPYYPNLANALAGHATHGVHLMRGISDIVDGIHGLHQPIDTSMEIWSQKDPQKYDPTTRKWNVCRVDGDELKYNGIWRSFIIKDGKPVVRFKFIVINPHLFDDSTSNKPQEIFEKSIDVPLQDFTPESKVTLDKIMYEFQEVSDVQQSMGKLYPKAHVVEYCIYGSDICGFIVDEKRNEISLKRCGVVMSSNFLHNLEKEMGVIGAIRHLVLLGIIPNQGNAINGGRVVCNYEGVRAGDVGLFLRDMLLSEYDGSRPSEECFDDFYEKIGLKNGRDIAQFLARVVFTNSSQYLCGLAESGYTINNKCVYEGEHLIAQLHTFSSGKKCTLAWPVIDAFDSDKWNKFMLTFNKSF